MAKALRPGQLPSANHDRQSGQTARAPEYQRKQGRAEGALRCLRRNMLTCLLRSGVDRKPGRDVLVVAAQRDLILVERTIHVRGQIRTTQGDRPAIAVSRREDESGLPCRSWGNGQRGGTRGQRVGTPRSPWSA